MNSCTTKAHFITLVLAASVSSGCSNFAFSGAPSTITPQLIASRPARIANGRSPNIGSKTNNVYVSEYENGSDARVLGYGGANRRDKKPSCSRKSPYAHDIAIDGKGNVIVAGGFGVTTVYNGSPMCGKKLGVLPIGWGGLAVNAASSDAANGTVAVAALQDGSGPGSIELCTLRAGCTGNLKNNDMNFVMGVALANDGDCWASSEQGPSMGYAPVLTYFKGCTGSGETARGFQNAATGGLDLDDHGNLVVISSATPAVYVYSGCKPQCKLVGGPFALHGTAMYGHLNAASTRFVTADTHYGQVNVYRYTPTAITYLYAFNNGISPSSGIQGAAFDPRSRQ